MHSIKITPQEQMRSMPAGREEKPCTQSAHTALVFDPKGHFFNPSGYFSSAR